MNWLSLEPVREISFIWIDIFMQLLRDIYTEQMSCVKREKYISLRTIGDI